MNKQTAVTVEPPPQTDAAVRLVVTQRNDGPERLVCEAELWMGPACGALAGFKIVGFSIWRSPEDEWYVTFPSRAFGSGTERRFFDFVRSYEEGSTNGKRLKSWILDQVRTQGVPPRG